MTSSSRAGSRLALGGAIGAGIVLAVLGAGELVSARAARSERRSLRTGPAASSRIAPHPARSAHPARHARPARSVHLAHPPHPAREVIVVLGYGNPGSRINAINRWRVDVGLRSRDPSAARSLLVMAGGAVHGEVSEAEHMARYARGVRGVGGPLVLEDQSVTTWQNVANVLPLLEDADRIVLASDPLHAIRAQGFLRAQRPDLAARLAAADDHRPGEQLLRKPLFALLGLEGLRRARRDRLIL